MDNLQKIVYRRHSTRSFDPDYIICRQQQEDILKAGLRAPSPKNRQPWSFVVLDQKADIQRASLILIEQTQIFKEKRKLTHSDTEDLDMAKTTAEIIKDVSMLVLICYVRDEKNEHGDSMDWPLSAQAFEVADIQSIGACIENMILMAESMDISSLWICDVLYAESRLSKAFNLQWPLVSAVAFGKASPLHTPRYSLDMKATWFDADKKELSSGIM